MRDIAAPLTSAWRVIAPDLRGHGDSDNTGSYAMAQFVADLKALYDHFGLSDAVLVGHSLGGHIVTRFAGIWPACVSGLIIIDGMGPPRAGEAISSEMMQEGWRRGVEGLLGLRHAPRQMADREEALARLTRNNPKLSPSLAAAIVDDGIEAHPGGGVCWKWDSRVQMVWNTFDHDETERMCQFVSCPVLLVTGEHSMDYWMGIREFDPVDIKVLHDESNRRRVRLFRDARHVEIPGAGHMIHYDQPERLNDEIAAFLAASPAGPHP